MVKKHLNMLPTPLSDLFVVNNTRHDHITRQHNDFHIDIGIKDYLVFMVHISGTIFPKTMVYTCFKNLSKMYIYILYLLYIFCKIAQSSTLEIP